MVFFLFFSFNDIVLSVETVICITSLRFNIHNTFNYFLYPPHECNPCKERNLLCVVYSHVPSASNGVWCTVMPQRLLS